MSIELIMPKAGLTNTEGTVGDWKVNEGAAVKKGDTILEIENEKVTMEFNSPGDGILHITAETGTEVLVGGIMGYLAENQAEYALLRKAGPVSGTEPERADVNAAVSAEVTAFIPAAAGKRVKASPLARKRAAKAGIDLSLIQGTGPAGRIVAKDVAGFVAAAAALPERSNIKTQPVGEVIRVPHTAARKAIAKRMQDSLRSMAQTSASVELDVTELVALRKRLASQEERLGTRITLNDLLSRAVVKMLKEHPLANATWTDKELIMYPYVNLNVAVAAEHGLTTPVVKNAEQLSLVELSKALKNMVVKARDNKLRLDDLADGTFTISNMGIFPVDNFNPIVNPPQSAILGFGRTVEKSVIYQDGIARRMMMVMSITYDHRIFDGLEVGKIMKCMKEYLENPEMILL